MIGRLRTLAIVAGALLLIGVGLFFLKAPKPHVEIKAEPLWTIGFFEITNTLFTSWIVVVVLLVIALLATRRMRFIPSGFQNAMESIIEAIYTLCVDTVGEKNGRRFFPVIATIFLFVLVANWMALLPIFNVIGKIEEIGVEDTAFREDVFVFEDNGLFMIMPNSKEVQVHFDDSVCAETDGFARVDCLEAARLQSINAAIVDENIDGGSKVGILAPYLRGVNTDLMSPLSLAIISAIFVEWWGISTLGFFAYGGKFFDFRRLRHGNPMGVIDFFVGILELIAEIARIISFTFRLFGNMLAGEILLLMMTFLIPFLLALPFYGLEIFVGAIQAFVFAMLTLVFAALAVTSHDDHEAESHTAGGEVAAVHTAE